MDTLDKLYQESEKYASNIDIPNLYKAEIEIAYREGAMFGIKLVQQNNQFDIKSIQG